ncbi:MAG TPA: polysaccharide biosynthesis tyrosine autokinase [Armatimonadota bacterium]|nr:polysaccharide biosynthesis tyrosine autokinase [Armatimonadota bacterium]
MELWRYYRILRRRRWLIIACMAICVGLVAVHCEFMTPVLYEAEVQVMERQPAERGISVYGDRYVMQPNIEIHLADLAHIAASDMVRSRSIETLEQLGVAINPAELMRTLKVEPLPATQILALRVTSEYPSDAKSAADVVAAEFKRFHSELKSGADEQSREFIEKQLKDAQNKMTEAREARKNFKTENELVELAGQTKVLIERVAVLESQIIDATANIDNLRNRLGPLNDQINSKPEMRLSSETVADNPIYQQLLAKKMALEAEFVGMTSGDGETGRRGKNHPAVKELQRQIDAVDAQLKTQLPKIINNQVTSLDSNVVQTIQSKLMTEAEVAGVQARRDALLTALDEERAKLQELPEQEMKMAKLDLDVLAAEETYRLLRAKLDEARITAKQASTSSAIQIIGPAVVYRVNAKKPIKLALALLLSPLLGAALAFLLHYLDNTVRTPAETEELLGLPVVSVVPLARSHALARRPDNEPLLATYEMLTTILWRNVAHSESPVVLVASAEPETGRSTTAANLAVTLAHNGARVILVDADMRKPNLHMMFGVAAKPGLSNVLTGTIPLEDALIPTKVEGLLLMPAGPAPDNPIRLLRSEKMSEFVSQIGALADFVIFDSPAGVTFADSSLIASLVKNVVLVHAAGRVPRGAESEFRGKLDLVGADILGVVLNLVRPEDSHGYFHYRKFYKGLTAQTGSPVLTGVRAIPPGNGSSDGKDS